LDSHIFFDSKTPGKDLNELIIRHEELNNLIKHCPQAMNVWKNLSFHLEKELNALKLLADGNLSPQKKCNT